MTTIIDDITREVDHGLASFDLPEGTERPHVYSSSNDKFGDYQTNFALKTAKKAGKNPRELAQAIADTLSNVAIWDECDIGGPGFINFKLSRGYLEEKIREMKSDDRLGIPQTDNSFVILDYSSPNLAKNMHVGHLRSTIIGDAIANVLEFSGCRVERVSHIGDWGTQYGMLIANLRDRFPIMADLQNTPIQDIEAFYKEAKKKFDSDPEFAARSRHEVVSLQSGEEQAVAYWQVLCRLSKENNQEVYDLLNVKLEDRGESFYNQWLPEVVEEFKNAGMVTESDGAECVFLDGFTNKEGEPLPLIIRKADGGYNYATTDLAALRYRLREQKADRIIYVTDAGQSTHFQMVFAAAEKIGWVDPQCHQVEHVPFGLVLGEDRKRFRTRSSETVKLKDLLREAVERAGQVNAEKVTDLTPEERADVNHAVGIGAVKYADLSQNRTTDYIFSFNKMLNLNGNTAPYLLYAYVRVHGIWRKSGRPVEELSNERIVVTEPSERALIRHLLRFPEVLAQVRKDLLLNSLADYLYELSQRFSNFYQQHKVIGSDQEASRLQLCRMTADVLGTGLNLLGIRLVERM